MDTSNDDTILGAKVSTTPSPRPPHTVILKGEYVTLTALTETHMPSLWKNLDQPQNTQPWNYLPWGTPAFPSELWDILDDRRKTRGFVTYAINANLDRLGPRQDLSTDDAKYPHDTTVGVIAYIDIQPADRALEVGAVLFAPALQRTVAATEVHYLMLRLAFDGVASTALAPELTAGAERAIDPPYRRVVWMCNTLNTPSRRAAERLGYVHEGTMRQHKIDNGRNRNSHMLSMLDGEWISVKAGLEGWLRAENFDEEGRQRVSLDEMRRQAVEGNREE